MHSAAHDELNQYCEKYDPYFAEPETIRRLEDEGRVAFRYCTADGDSNDEANPNGSINNIAGILNERGNVLGMMPHPERYADKALGCDDGMAIFQSIANAMRIAMPL